MKPKRPGPAKKAAPRSRTTKRTSQTKGQQLPKKRRVLVTGLATFWGGRMAQALERDPSVEVVIGLDMREPTVELERTEFVRADQSYSILDRLIRATRCDTVVHSFLADSSETSDVGIHEQNVIGTMNLLAACGSADSTVRQLVVKSSTKVYGTNPKDPTWFVEGDRRTRPAPTEVERSLLEAEVYVEDFHHEHAEISTSVLRFANVLGANIETPISRLLSMWAVPGVIGFDPLLQFVEETDVVRALLFAVDQRLRGLYNVAADGKLPWSEVASICALPLIPILPASGWGALRAPARLIGIDVPTEVRRLLTYGRGVDNRKIKDAGFAFEYTSAGAVQQHAKAQRLKDAVSGVYPQTYRYQDDVERFFRHSPWAQTGTSNRYD